MNSRLHQWATSSLVRYGVLYPIPTLIGLFLVSEVIGIGYGDIVFFISIPVAAVWVVIGLAGRRLAASIPAFELLFGTASAYSTEDPEMTAEHVSRGGAVLIYLTGIIALGWVSLIASLVVLG